jgi:hypothetical protein
MEKHHHRGAFVLLTIILVFLAFYTCPEDRVESFEDGTDSEHSESCSESEGSTV